VGCFSCVFITEKFVLKLLFCISDPVIRFFAATLVILFEVHKFLIADTSVVKLN